MVGWGLHGGAHAGRVRFAVIGCHWVWMFETRIEEIT
jgi:hypothetical protein